MTLFFIDVHLPEADAWALVMDDGGLNTLVVVRHVCREILVGLGDGGTRAHRGVGQTSRVDRLASLVVDLRTIRKAGWLVVLSHELLIGCGP